jgi:MFS transporter, DHA1 family, multidrug resistance protein B
VVLTSGRELALDNWAISPLSITATIWLGYEWTFFLLSMLSFISAALYIVMFQQFEKRREKRVAALS